MTIRRRRRTIIEARPSKVLSAIDAIVGTADRYRASRPLSDDRREIVVRPTWFMLPTTLLVSVSDTAGGNAEVVVDTKSQWFILGDVFREYDRQIDRFVADVESQIAGSA